MAQGQVTQSVLQAIAGLFGQYADQSTKPGFKKSEFWLTALATGLSFVPAVGGPYGPIVGGLLALGYTALRTFVTARNSNTASSVAAAAATNPASSVTTVPVAPGAEKSYPPGRM